MPVLQSTCKCCSLRTGTLCVAGFSISVTSIATIILISVPFIMHVFFIVKISVALWSLMQVGFSILLLLGVLKKKAVLFLPFLVMYILDLIGSLVMSLDGVVAYFTTKKVVPASILLTITLISEGVMLYFWLVVFSYYQEAETQ